MKDPLLPFYRTTMAVNDKFSPYNPRPFAGVAIAGVPMLVFFAALLILHAVFPGAAATNWFDAHGVALLFGSVFILMVYFFCRFVFETKTSASEGDGAGEGSANHG